MQTTCQFFTLENSTLSSNSINNTENATPNRIVYHICRTWYFYFYPRRQYDQEAEYTTPQNDPTPGQLGGITSSNTSPSVYSSDGTMDNQELLLLLIPFALLCGILVLLIALLIFRARLSRLLKRQIESQASRRHLASMHRASTMSRALVGNSENNYVQAPTINDSRNNLRSTRQSFEAVMNLHNLPTIQEGVILEPTVHVYGTPPQDDVNYTEIYMSRPITTNGQK